MSDRAPIKALSKAYCCQCRVTLGAGDCPMCAHAAGVKQAQADVDRLRRENNRLQAVLWSIGHAAGCETREDLMRAAREALPGGADTPRRICAVNCNQPVSRCECYRDMMHNLTGANCGKSD
jgi:hypothetical protein